MRALFQLPSPPNRIILQQDHPPTGQVRVPEIATKTGATALQLRPQTRLIDH